MWKSVVYTILTMCLYFLLIEGIGLLLTSELAIEILSNIDERFLLFLDSFIYLILIGIAVIFIYKYIGILYDVPSSKVALKNFIQIILIAILIRIFEDPILRMDIITGRNELPDAKIENTKPLIELVSMVFSTVLLVSVLEEILFRKIMLSFFNQRNLFVGIIISSLIFASIHFNSLFPNYIPVFLIFLFGLVLCFIYIRYGLFYSILLHIIYNAIWLITLENENLYWSIISKLDYGLWYWVIEIVSLGLLLYILRLVYRSNCDNQMYVSKLVNE